MSFSLTTRSLKEANVEEAVNPKRRAEKDS